MSGPKHKVVTEATEEELMDALNHYREHGYEVVLVDLTALKAVVCSPNG